MYEVCGDRAMILFFAVASEVATKIFLIVASEICFATEIFLQLQVEL
jgi:hypothetical protein